ncbi:hypothetical protein RLOatenuis_0300 [Rickettsiales bacterium]|nr:hypothetical protein RLOatenuis_0300 [Rickettsiales bacterium]
MTTNLIHELTHVACFLCFNTNKGEFKEISEARRLPYELEDREAARLFSEAVKKDLVVHKEADTYFYNMCKQQEESAKGNQTKIIGEYIAYAVAYLATQRKETDPPLTHITKFIVDHWLPKIACAEDQELVRELQRNVANIDFGINFDKSMTAVTAADTSLIDKSTSEPVCIPGRTLGSA